MTPEQTKLLLDIKFLAEQLQHETTLSKVNQILEIEEREKQPEKWSITGEGNLERNKGDLFPAFGSHIINSEPNKEHFLTIHFDNESDPNNLEVSGKD